MRHEEDAPDVLLINPPYPRRYGGGVVPPIGLCYLAASLRAVGARVQILDLASAFPEYSFADRDRPLQQVADLLDAFPRSPALIGVGPLVTATLRSTADLLEVCRKKSEAMLVLGGPLCAAPGIGRVVGSFLDADAYVAGDGEGPIREIWSQVVQGQRLSNRLGIGTPGSPEPAPYREYDLDTLPVPARDLLDGHYQASARRTIDERRITSAFLSRGCPYSCSFCAAPLSSGKRVRRFSPSRISLELASCGELGFGSIIFYDDCLFVRSHKLSDRVLEFCQVIETSGWRGAYQLELRCDAVEVLSLEAMEALARTGCRQINMGIEKGHVAQLKQLQKRLSPEVARTACERVNEVGIRAAGTFILGGQGETPEIIRETIEYAKSLPLDYAHFNPLAVYPGTVLFQQVFPEEAPDRWLHLCLNEGLAPLGDILWRSEMLPLTDILDAVHHAYREFYTDDRLERVLAKLPPAEHEATRASYRVLAQDRGRSWSERAPARSDLQSEAVVPC